MVGKYRDNRDGLVFSEEKIEITIKAGEVFKGHFTIESNIDEKVEGYVYSSSLRMRTKTNTFSGSSSVIYYIFDASGMQPGDVLKGNFSIVSSAGEYVLPFVTMVSYDIIDSSIGTIKNMFHFTNLAKTDWNEAVRIFNLPGFVNIISEKDTRYRNMYLGLIGRGNRNYNLEEFLVGINKKQMMEYSVDKDTIRIAEPHGSVRQSVELERNGWGYTMIAVRAEGEFIDLQYNKLTEENFEGNRCHYEFVIHENRLRSGINYGRITFRHLYGELSVDIIVTNRAMAHKDITAHKRKSVRYSLIRHYIDHVSGLISQAKWIQLTEELVNHRSNVGYDELENSMYQAHLLLIQERYNEAKWLLDHKITEGIEEASNELYCYYLYLMSLYNVDDYYTREVFGTVKGIYEKDSDNWRVAWVLMHLSDEFKRNPARQYAFGIRQISRGCDSPLFYASIIKLLNAVPSLLVHFDDDEKRLLLFAARKRLVSEELQGQIAYHANRQREYDSVTFKILKALYDIRPDLSVAEAICSQLMKGGLIGSKYYQWYKIGVENNFQITRLYENFMLSLDLLSEHAVPRDVLIYFSYESALPVEQTSYLYAYVVKNREKMPDIYRLYEDGMKRFIVKQLYAGRINRDLAYLYQEIVMKEMATVDNIRQFARVLLVHCIRVSDKTICNVIVIDERLKEEMVFPVENEIAYVVLPSSEYTLLLEDTLGNRFYQTKEYVTERYFLPRKLLPKIELYTEDSVLFDLYICEGNSDFITVTDRNVGRYKYLEQADEVSNKFRAAVRLPLIRYYQDHDDTVKVDELLENTSRDDVPFKDRDELLRLYISRGFIDKAFEYARYYGAESIDAGILVRIATLAIERDGYIYDEGLLSMIASAFERGKYNEVVLQYLASFYKGLLKNLRNIWKAAAGFYVDTYSICETMIEQTLITGAYVGEEAQILKEYVGGGAKAELEMEYLTYFAEEYFVNDRVVDDFMFREMARLYENEGTLPNVCMLAFLKHYADEGNVKLLDDNIKSHIRRYIKLLYVEQKIVMPFMQEFREISADAQSLSNLTMIEYYGEPGSRVVINYMLSSNADSGHGYIREEMSNVYDGVFVKAFMLFFGESVQYYITEKNGGIEQLTESGSIEKSDADTDGPVDRFTIVNDIAIASTLRDYDTALKLLEDYKYREFVTDSLFAKQ